jgi:hypothetical protein
MSATRIRPGVDSRRRQPRSTHRAQPVSAHNALFDAAPATDVAEFEPLVSGPAVERVAAPPAGYPRIAEPGSWWEWFSEVELARAERLRPLWEMSPARRIAAMHRGELTYEQLAAWTARHPEQVPLLNGEFEWIAARMPEVCE